MACATLVVSAAAIVGVKAYNHSQLSDLAPKFPKEKTVNISSIGVELVLDSPNSMFYVDDCVIMQSTSANNKNVYQVISVNEGKHIGGFGFNGRGPNELENYFCSDINLKKREMYCISTMGKFQIIDLDKALKADPTCVKQTYKMPKHIRGMEMFSVGDNLLIGEANRYFGRQSIISMDGKDTLVRYNTYPSVSPRIDEDENNQIAYFSYGRNYARNPNGTKMVNIVRPGMIMEVFSISQSEIKHDVIRHFYEPKEGAIRGCTNVYATNKYVYITYFDTKDTKNHNPYLAVFDWRGREVCRYITNDYISDFVVTHDDKRAYCWTQNADGEEYLGYFDLK